MTLGYSINLTSAGEKNSAPAQVLLVSIAAVFSIVGGALRHHPKNGCDGD